MSGERLDTEEFWIVGDFAQQVFARWGRDARGCRYVDCLDPARAERYDTYRDALKHCRKADMVRWRKSRRDPKAVKPLRCRVQVAVYPPGARP